MRKEDGYGEYNNDMIIELGKDVFKVEDKIDEEMLKIGNIVPMQNDQGRQLNGKIISVSDDKVKMDFNHPLAGEDLYFEGVILEIREATKEELEQKQAQ